MLVTYVCVYVPAVFPHYCMDQAVTWGNGRGWPVVVQYWEDLQSVHGFHGCDNIAPNAKCQQVLCTHSMPGLNREKYSLFF